MDGGSHALVLVEKAENPHEHGVRRQIVEHRKTPPVGTAADRLGLASPEKRQRVVEDMPYAIEAPCVVAVATAVNDRTHLTSALDPAQLAGDAVRQPARPAELRADAR